LQQDAHVPRNALKVFLKQKNKAEIFCALNNTKENLGLSDIIIREYDTDDDEIAESEDKVGYVYEVYKPLDGAYGARLESIMFKSVFYNTEEKVCSWYNGTPYVWVEKQSEKLAIEAYLREKSHGNNCN
jgi:hypothetical protein